jgi:thiol-disulfide isomerase/thioredoxin
VGAITIGPLALSLQRAFGLLGIITFVVGGGIAAKKWPALAGWDGGATLSGLILGRLWYVGTNASVFWADPLSILYVWQGGFSALGAVVGVSAFTLWHFRGRLRRGLPGFGLLLIAFLVWGIPTAVSDVTASGGEPITLPSMSLSALDGTEVDVADYQGIPTVINFWATWCPPCRREMPMLASVARSVEDARFLIVNQGEDRGEVENYLAAENFQIPNILLDPQQRLGAHFGIRGLPTTLFFDSSGELVDYHFGELSKAGLQDYLEKL